MPKAPSAKLTPKQAKFVQGVAEGKSYRQAAMNAYDVATIETAAVIASENLTKPNVKQAVEEALAIHEITPAKATLIVKRSMEYVGDTDRDSLEMNLKGFQAYVKLLAMTEDKQNNTGGNTINFNNTVSKTYIK